MTTEEHSKNRHEQFQKELCELMKKHNVTDLSVEEQQNFQWGHGDFLLVANFEWEPNLETELIIGSFLPFDEFDKK